LHFFTTLASCNMSNQTDNPLTTATNQHSAYRTQGPGWRLPSPAQPNHVPQVSGPFCPYEPRTKTEASTAETTAKTAAKAWRCLSAPDLASALFPPAVPAIYRRRPRCMRKGFYITVVQSKTPNTEVESCSVSELR
jgi:hypothetical protein